VLIPGGLGAPEIRLFFGCGSGWLCGKCRLFGRSLFDDERRANRSAPILGAEGVDVFVLGNGKSLDEGLAEVSKRSGGLGFEMALGHGGEEATEGRAEIAGRDELTGEVVSDVFTGLIAGEGVSFPASMAGAEGRVGWAARSAASTAVGKGEGTKGRAVLGAKNGHGNISSKRI
jgi:hypothetical protein